MKRLIACSSFVVLFAVSAPALAQQPPPPPAHSQWDNGAPAPAPAGIAGDIVPNGFQLNLDVFGLAGALNIATGAVAAGTGSTSLSAASANSSLDVGYYFDQNSILLDIGFEATSGTDIFFAIAPTYRRYFTLLRAGQVTPFAEGSLVFGIAAPNAAPAAFALGLGGGVGAEWMFTKMMGIEGKATLGYLHENNGDNFNVDAISIGGQVGLTIHI